MNRYVRLLDYNDRPKRYTIENFENVMLLHFKILSGDGVLTVIYKNNTTETFVDYTILMMASGIYHQNI